MTDLTTALAALGGLVLAGVVAHGAWTARKAGPKQMATLEPRPEPREPVMDAVDSGPVIDRLQPARRMALRLDALIDAIATLTVEAPVAGSMLQSHLPGSRRAGSKPFLIEGLNAETGEWEPPASDQRYGELQAGVQLANRSGALNEIEYSEFVQKVQSFAEAVGAMPDFPDMLDVVARARELDAFAGEHDAQLAVHLQARGAAWSVGYVQQQAALHGFVASVLPGRMLLPGAHDGAPPVLSLGFDSQAALAELGDNPNQAALRDITLNFDVPQTDAKAEPFTAWQACAQALAQGMQANLVDDNGQPLSAEGFAAIGNELGQLYGRLESHDLAAGSAAARRLFS